MTWQRRAACRASPQLFDLDLDEPETPKDRLLRHGRARGICNTCPVFTDCLIDALEDPHGADGIRAGHLLNEGHRA